MVAYDESDYDERHDHDQAREAVEHGEALPLGAVLAAVEKKVVGEIVGIEFEKSEGVWVYEFKVVDAAGHVIEVLVGRVRRKLGVDVIATRRGFGYMACEPSA